MERDEVYSLVSQWFGGNLKILTTIAIFVWLTLSVNRNNRRKWIYPDLESARRPVPHSDEVPIPVFDHLTELIESYDELVLLMQQ